MESPTPGINDRKAASSPARFDVEIDDRQRLAELRGAGQDRTIATDDHRVAVEDQLVLAADLVDVGDRHIRLDRPLGECESSSCALAEMERRGVHVDHQIGATPTEVGDRAVGHPRVLTDRHPERNTADVEQPEGFVAGDEVPLLVEHRVVGEPTLAVDPQQPAGGADRHGVVPGGQIRPALGDRAHPTAPVDVDETHDGDARSGPGDDLLERLEIVLHEPVTEHEVLRRVAGHRQLGESHEGAPGPLGLGHGCGDQPQIAGQVADHRVDLSEAETHGWHPPTLRARRLPAHPAPGPPTLSGRERDPPLRPRRPGRAQRLSGGRAHRAGQPRRPSRFIGRDRRPDGRSPRRRRRRQPIADPRHRGGSGHGPGRTRRPRRSATGRRS